MHDLLVKNGTIVDGTGADGFIGDVAVSSGRMTAIGQVDGHAQELLVIGARLIMAGPSLAETRTGNPWRRRSA